MITLKTEISDEPILTAATLINQVVCDLLHQNKFSFAHFPELVDLAVVGTGLGMLQSNLGFVNNTGSFWDSTQWEILPRPFLDTQSLAYAFAIAAWVRGDQQGSDWIHDLRIDVKRPMQKSLKYLFSTNDSFFQPTATTGSVLEQSQSKWEKLAQSDSASKQIVAIRHLDFEGQQNGEQEALLLSKLQSGNREILLHSIEATQRLPANQTAITDELRLLVENRDDEIRAKAVCSLSRLSQLDESTINAAAKMLDSRVKFIVFAGLFALSSLDAVSDDVLPAANRGFIRALQNCDYEFVGLFTAAFNRWFEDPQSYVEELLSDDCPEYLELGLETLQNVRQQLVASD